MVKITEESQETGRAAGTAVLPDWLWNGGAGPALLCLSSSVSVLFIIDLKYPLRSIFPKQQAVSLWERTPRQGLSRYFLLLSLEINVNRLE